MSDNLDITAIANEIVRYGKQNPLELQGTVLSPEIVVNKLNPKPLSKVKGKWTFPLLLVGHVIQAFSDKWTPYGMAQFQAKIAKNFHQKVNFPVNPYDAYGSWIEEMYEEEKTPAEMPISKYIMNTVLPPVIISDLSILSVTGEYDATDVGSPTPTFGKSMDGLNKIVTDMVANTTHPVFKIPTDAADNIVDRVTAFEKGLPQHVKVDFIVVSMKEFTDYVELRETPTDKFIDFNDPQRGKTKFGRTIIGIPGRTDNQILAWVSGNFYRIYDRKDNPAVIDMVQVQDYIMKIFSQFHLGYDFAVNELVYVETQDADDERGLNNAEKNAMFYPHENLNVTP